MSPFILRVHELVNGAKGWCIANGTDRSTDAERVDGRAGGQELVDPMFVEIAGRENPRRQAARIEDRPHFLRERAEVSTVEPHGRGTQAGVDDAPRRPHGVIGVDEKGRGSAEDIHVCPKRLDFVLECHDPRMRHRPDHGNAEPAPGFDVRRALEPDEIGGTCGETCGLEAMRATTAEFHERPSARRVDDPRGFARDRGLEPNRGKQRGLDELRLDGRGRHSQQRLVREDDLALVYRPDLACEPKRREDV